MGAGLVADGRIVHSCAIGTCLCGGFSGSELVFDQDQGHLGQLRGQPRRFLGVLEGLLVLVELGEDGAELKDKAAVVAGQVDGALENLASRPILSLAVALKPVLNAYLGSLLGFCLFGFADRSCLLRRSLVTAR